MNAKELIKLERARQIAVEGWTEAHDDWHQRGEMAAAAHCYETNDATGWPWDMKWWKPGGNSPIDEARRLQKAGALIRAEAERLERVERDIEASLTKAIRKAVESSATPHDGHR